jgi:hypothetical protein
MPISQEYLPSELHYIIPLAEQHGTDARVSKFDHRLGRHVSYAEALSAQEIEPLRQLYGEIRAKGHSLAINRWHEEHGPGKTPCPAETTWPIFGLLCLFDQLRKLDVTPFNDGTVGPLAATRQVAFPQITRPPDSESSTADAAPSRRTAVTFGALAGALIGSIAGVACQSILAADESFGIGAVTGGVIGFVVGILIGRFDARKRPTAAESNVGTYIGVLYGLAPGILFLLEGMGLIGGNRSGLIVIAAFFASPMAGMLIGGVLDRIYEGLMKPRISEPTSNSE